MNIVIVTDNHYAQYAGVMLTSLYENTQRSSEIQLYVIHNELSRENQTNIENIVEKYCGHIHFIRAEEDFTDFHEGNYVSKAAYLKINIPHYLPSTAHTALYLDGDIVINFDISNFYNIDISDYYLAAVNDDNEKLAGDLGVPLDSYFNSGVLMINLDKWRENEVSASVYKYVVNPQNTRNTCDQDALNHVLWDKWLKLDRSYNFLLVNHEGIENPKLIHYAAKDKPWHVLYAGELGEKYNYYKDICNWNNYRQQDLEILKSHKIIIQGASTAGKAAYESILRANLDIEFFIDNDNRKHGTTLMNRYIKHIDSLNTVDGDFVIIVPSLSYFDEIKTELKQRGFEPMKICNKIFMKT